MYPDSVIDAQDHADLIAALTRLATRLLTPQERQALLQLVAETASGVIVTGDPFSFANQLVAALLRPPISEKDDKEHPLLRLIDHCLRLGPANYGLSDDDADLFTRLLDDGRDRTHAVRRRRGVGKIEDEQGNGIGTGVLAAPARLLTCDHVRTKTGARRAWVRFGYRARPDGTVARGERWELDLGDPVVSGGGSYPDYALLTVNGDAGRPALPLSDAEVNAGQAVRLIHHPDGKPAAVSDAGKVSRVGDDYILHDVPTAEGSSGAPVFDRAWNVIALHRGNTDRAARGVTEAVRVSAFLRDLAGQL
jgi:V8-like Glu-specific endopeptidase